MTLQQCAAGIHSAPEQTAAFSGGLFEPLSVPENLLTGDERIGGAPTSGAPSRVTIATAASLCETAPRGSSNGGKGNTP